MSSEPYDSRTDRLKASPPLFGSPFLDRFTRVHHLVPVVLYGPVVLACLVVALSPPARRGGGRLRRGRLPAVDADGVLAAPDRLPLRARGRDRARLHCLIHGVHHDHPNDPKRLVMPPARRSRSPRVRPALRAGLRPRAGAVTAGFLAGYLVYDAALRAAPPASRRRGSGGGCASCTCATTSRTTPTATASAPRGGTASSAPRGLGAAAAERRVRPPRSRGGAPARRAAARRSPSRPWPRRRGRVVGQPAMSRCAHGHVADEARAGTAAP